MSNQLKRIGILGGTFDPIHNGHLGLARETMQLFDLQKILFIPVNRSPHKVHYQPTSSKHRVAMLELALEQETTFPVDLIEIAKGGVSYTIDTLSPVKGTAPRLAAFPDSGRRYLYDDGHLEKLCRYIRNLRFVGWNKT